MDRILALLTEIKGFFSGFSANLAKITAAEDQVRALNAELATTKTESSGKDTKILELTAALQTAQEQVNAKGTEIQTLQTALDTEKSRANNTIASQGISSDQLPAGGVGAEAKGSAFARYRQLMAEDPKAASAFYAENADAILASRPK